MKKDFLLLILLVFLKGCQSSERDYLYEQISTGVAISNEYTYISYNQYLDSLEKGDLLRDYSHAIPPIGKWRDKTVTEDLEVANEFLLLQDYRLADSIWSLRPWHLFYPERISKLFVFPYRIAEEPLDYTWRRQSFSDWSKYAIGETPLEMSQRVLSEVSFRIFSMFRGVSGQRYELYHQYLRGTCDDYCLYAAQILRAQGIPVSIDFIPSWGSHNLGHSFNTLIGRDGENICSFNDVRDFDSGFKLAHKVPKIYRFLHPHDKVVATDIPPLFKNNDLIDVTSSFRVPSYTIQINSERAGDNQIWLAVPHFKSWSIVARGYKTQYGYCFENVGAGYLDGKPSDYGENIGDGILYIPVFYSSGRVDPADNPFVLSSSGVIKVIKPSSGYETVTLYRKYPRLKRIIDFADELSGCLIEGANRPDFTDAKRIYTLPSLLKSHSLCVDMPSAMKYRYLRIRRPKGGFSVAEFGALDELGNLIPRTAFVPEYLGEDSSSNHICDDNSLSYFACYGAFYDLWVGLDLGKKRSISKVILCPRTDDNDVTPGHQYELLIWKNNQWQRIKKKKANDYSITFEHVPKGALLLLHDQSGGQEERPFTIEDGNQIWW